MARFPDTEDGVHNRAYRFALEVARAMDELPSQKRSAEVVSRQFTKAASSVGANLWEANAAQTLPDFITKCSVALKEANESHFWLRLSRDLGLLQQSTGARLELQRRELTAILTTIIHGSTESISKTKRKSKAEQR